MSSRNLLSSSKDNPAVMSSIPLMGVHYYYYRLLWSQGSTYDSVCEMHVRYVTQKYGLATKT